MTLTSDALPEGSRGRLLALAMTALAAGLLWLGVGAPLVDWYDARESQIGDRRTMLGRMEALVAATPALRDAAAGSQTAQGEASLLKDPSDAIAGATMQSLLQDMAKSAEVSVTSVETLPGEQLSGFRRIGLRTVVSATWPALLILLKSIDMNGVGLLVDDLQVRVVPRVGPASAGPTPIEASFVVFGFRAGQSAGNGGAAVTAVDSRTEVRSN